MTFYLLLTCLFLGLLSVSDMKTKTIPGWAPLLFAASMLLLHLFRTDLEPVELITGLIPGALLLVLSIILKSSIGAGDGLTVLACGCALGFSYSFPGLILGLFICGIVSAALLLCHKVKRSDTLPFLPFLAAAHFAVFLMELI